MQPVSKTHQPLPAFTANVNAIGTIGNAQGTPVQDPPPQIETRPTTPEDVNMRRRASQREAARVLGASAKPVWELNDTAGAQLEAILGMSLTPKSAGEAEALRAVLDSHIEKISHYIDLCKSYKAQNKQPGEDISRLDGQLAPHMVAMENIRHPKLGMMHFDGLPQFMTHLRAHVETGAPLARRVLVRTGEDDEETLHHVYIDVVNRNGKLSLIVLEAANLNTPAVKHGLDTVDEALQDLQSTPYSWSYLATNNQNSEYDCLQFVLSLGKKSSDHEEFMDSLHDKQLAGQALHPSEPESYIAEWEQSVMEGRSNMHCAMVDAGPLLPLAFFKHMQPPAGVDALLAVRPQDANVPVNKPHPQDNRPAQTLEERTKAHIPEEGRERTRIKPLQRARTFYSLSIEEKRLVTAEKTLALFKHLRDSIPAMS